MKTITIYMQAGGVGKTSITCMLAYELGKIGKTLIIDADQQSNTTLQFVNEYGSVAYVFENPDLIKKFCKKEDLEEESIFEEIKCIQNYCNQNSLNINDFFTTNEILQSYSEKEEKDIDTLKEFHKMFQKFAAKNCKDFVSVLKGDEELEDVIINVRKETEEYKGLYVLPSKNTDTKLQNFYESVDFRDEPEIINNIINKAEELDFEYILFDLPPTFGYAQRVILSNCTDIIPIINPDEKSADGLMRFGEHLDKVKDAYKAKFKMNNYLIINRSKKDNKVHQYYSEDLKNNSQYRVFEFPESNSITSAASQKKVVQEWQKSSKLCDSIKELADELIKGE